jgi:hypothetical protein
VLVRVEDNVVNLSKEEKLTYKNILKINKYVAELNLKKSNQVFGDLLFQKTLIYLSTSFYA